MVQQLEEPEEVVTWYRSGEGEEDRLRCGRREEGAREVESPQVAVKLILFDGCNPSGGRTLATTPSSLRTAPGVNSHRGYRLAASLIRRTFWSCTASLICATFNGVALAALASFSKMHKPTVAPHFASSPTGSSEFSDNFFHPLTVGFALLTFL